MVCLLLAFFGAIGYFKTDEGAFIALFCNLLKGLCGYGFYIAPPMLLASAVILAVSPGEAGSPAGDKRFAFTGFGRGGVSSVSV